MFRHMLLGLGAASLLVVVTAMPVQAAAIPLPTELQALVVTRGALEWVWVNSCVENAAGNSCSFLEGVEAFGFGPPTSTQQWTDSFGPDNGDGYFNLLIAFVPLNNPAGNCAYKFFSNEYEGGDVCQTGDLQAGRVSGAPYLPVTDLKLHPSAEVFWVYANAEYVPAPMPEPSSLLLLGAGLLGLAAWRWKHTA